MEGMREGKKKRETGRQRGREGGKQRDERQRQKRISGLGTSRNEKKAKGGLASALAFWRLSIEQD